ncbi:MAG: FIST N-terminal domain-containing protein [Azoarcus sp.]|nr:FIST N-terminal domain-containing protein [Azoarcus sp.]
MSLRAGQSLAADPRQAVEGLYLAIAQPDMALVVFFCSSRFDLGVLAVAINERFAGTPVIGCTTAGEIGPAGYRDGSLVGVSFSSASCVAAVGRIDRLAQCNTADAFAVAQALRQQVAGSTTHSFALLLIDGLCGREEPLAHALQSGLGDIPMVGGSAGDDQLFIATRVFADGAFRDDAAVLAVLKTELPFKVFRGHHFVGGTEPLVVTEADAHHRIVYEINGRPAATEYARAAGIGSEALTSAHFAATPMVVRINGNDYVRSIRQVNTDGSLTLYCAIDRGVVLRVARGLDLVQSRRALFDELRQRIGPPQLILGFDCIHCNAQARGEDGRHAIEQVFGDNRVLGFSSYGEQFMGLHVNQTFTGVAIGRAEGVNGA